MAFDLKLDLAVTFDSEQNIRNLAHTIDFGCRLANSAFVDSTFVDLTFVNLPFVDSSFVNSPFVDLTFVGSRVALDQVERGNKSFASESLGLGSLKSCGSSLKPNNLVVCGLVTHDLAVSGDFCGFLKRFCELERVDFELDDLELVDLEFFDSEHVASERAGFLQAGLELL